MKVRWPALLRLTRVLLEIARALERIGDSLERAYPIASPAKQPRGKPADIGDISSYDAEGDYIAEQEEERQRERGYDRISLAETNENDL
jgi:hypothetical protein